VGSVIVERFGFGADTRLLLLAGKWFVFWAVGVRLFTAGMRQISRPQFTAEEILGIHNPDALILVRELGFANLSMGLVGLLSLVFTSWVIPGAVAGGLFIGIAGINHVTRPNKNRLELLVTWSNIFVFVILALFVFSALGT